MLSDKISNLRSELHDLDLEFEQLERGSSSIYSQDISIKLDKINTNLKELNKLVIDDSKTTKDANKRRLQGLKTDYDRISNSLASYLKRKDQSNYGYQKRELFAGSSTASHENKNDLELDMAENGSLERSGRMLNEYIS